MQVIGLCRFSYPAIGGFQVEHDSIEARCAYLYDAKRIEERFRLFETVALPCLRAQSDPDFTLVLVIGDSLPKVHEDRLRDLVADIPQVRIEAHPPRQQRPVMKDILNAARHDLNAPCLQFRFDDDDAVSVDFVERLRASALDCAGLMARHRTVAVDFNMGYAATFGAKGIAATAIHRPFYTAALGMYVAGRCQQSIMNFAHQKIARFMPAVSYSDAPMFVRGLHSSNDSRQKDVRPADVTPLTPDLIEDFALRFAIREEAVRQAFSAT
ncbi:putative rhamnosyl transferase [Arenibacterium sp. LLYu02]|uniref:putative rhamnosyl transferase n=1 Tax=Arenibacterium sp. LLYu02 TaxID=3404132 RepID=UPI003B223C69